MSIAFLAFEVWFRYVMREWSDFYFLFEALVRGSVFLLTIIFVCGFWNDCWCAPPWQWQIGALTLFMAYINILLTLKRMPILGVPITMLLNIVVTFIKLIYLPVLLILAFAIPFYMVFVREVSLYISAWEKLHLIGKYIASPYSYAQGAMLYNVAQVTVIFLPV